MASLTIIGFALLLLLLIYKYILFPAFLSPLSKIPNAHFTAPFASLWISSKRRASAGTRAIFSLHQKHGPVLRLGPNELSICTPAALKTIYIGGFEKDRWYQDAFMNYGRPNMVSMLKHKPHSAQKRMVSNLYSKSYLQNSEELQKASTCLMLDRFMPIMQSVADKGVEMDVLDFFQGVGMDFTSAYLFGLSNGTDFMNDVQYRQHWLAQYSVSKDQLPQDRAGGEVERWCLAMCEAAEESLHLEKANNGSPATQPVVYGRLSQSLGVSSKKPDFKSSLMTIASEMLDHLVAGHETSGITLTYFMHELSKRPGLQDRLRSELLTLDPPVRPSMDYPASSGKKKCLPTPRSIDSLPLLDSLLQETLRLYAAAPAIQPRRTPFSPCGTTIEGYSNIPGGVRVSANAYTLHRNPEVFPEPLKWVPERWMDPTEGNREEMKRWFWAFGSGGRMCLGSNFAIQSIAPDFPLELASSFTVC